MKVQKTVTEGFGIFRRKKVVRLTTLNVYSGYHIPCIGGHQRLISFYKGQGKDISELIFHEKEYKKNYLRKSHEVDRFPTSNNNGAPPPLHEVEISQDHEFPSDMSVISSITEHLEGKQSNSAHSLKNPSFENGTTTNLNDIQEGSETQQSNLTAPSRFSSSFHDNVNSYHNFSDHSGSQSTPVELDQSNHTQGSTGKRHDRQRKMPPKFEESLHYQDEHPLTSGQRVSARRNTCPTGYIPDDNASPSNDVDYKQLFTTMREKNHEVHYLAAAMQIIMDSLDNSSQVTRLPPSWAKILISILQMNGKDKYLQAKSLHVFWKIVSSSSAEKDLFVSAGGVDFVAKSIYNHYECLPLSLFGNSMLANLAQSRNFSRTVSSRKNTTIAVTKTFSLITSSNHKNVYDTFYTCGCALQILDSIFQNSRTSDTIDAEIYQSLNDQSDFFTTALKQEKVDSAFISHIFKFLFSLSQRDDCGHSVPFLTSPELLELISKAMIGTFYRWENLQILMTGLVTNLVKHTHYSPTLILTKVAPAYIQTMETNSTSHEIQLHGCVFVRNVCCVDYSSVDTDRQEIPSFLSNKFGIIKMLLSRIKSHQANEAFVVECCQSLLALAIDSVLNKEIIINIDGIETLYDIFKYHCAQNNYEIVHPISMILSSLVENHRAILRLRETGFIHLILEKGMEPTTTHLDSFLPLIFNILCISIQKDIVDESYPKSLLDYYCKKMCETPENVLICMDLIGYFFQSGSFCGEGEKEIEFISLIMITYASSASIQNKACIALSKIHSKQLEYLTKLVGTSTEIKALLDSLRIHGHDKDLTKNACLTLYFYVKSVDKHNLSEGILDDLSHIMTAMVKIVQNAQSFSETIQIVCSILFLMVDLDKSLEERSTSRDRVGIFTNAFVQLNASDEEADEEGKLALLEFCVYLLSKNKNDAGSLVSQSFVTCVFNSISDPSLFDNVTFMERCCNVLVLLSMDISLMQQKVVDNVQYLESICNLMHRYDQSIPIQADTFLIVTHLALNDTIKAYFSTQGLVGLAMECIKKYRNNKVLMEQACGALNCLVGGTEPWILQGLEITLFSFHTINQNMDNEKIVENLMGVLRRISSINDDFKLEIYNSGSFRKITTVMMHHLGNETIQERGCFILWNLAKLKSSASQMNDQKIINDILNSLSAHINSSDVQNEGLGLLKTMSVISSVRHNLRLNNCIEVVLGAMWVHYNEEVIQLLGLMALLNLSVDGETSAVEEASEKELQTVVNSMIAFPLSNQIQEMACRYLRNLSFQPKNTLKIAANDQLLQLLNVAEKNFESTCKGRVDDVRRRIEEAFIASC